MKIMLTLSRENARLLCKLLTVKRQCRAAITVMKMSAMLLVYQKQYAKWLLSAPSCVKLESKLILRGCNSLPVHFVPFSGHFFYNILFSGEADKYKMQFHQQKSFGFSVLCLCDHLKYSTVPTSYLQQLAQNVYWLGTKKRNFQNVYVYDHKISSGYFLMQSLLQSTMCHSTDRLKVST